MKFSPLRLREARESAGLRVEDLAYFTRSSASTIARAEAGKHVPSANVVGAMASALKIDVRDLFVEETAGTAA
jgi:transcriptional regulator with XRE-family HTH domain